MFKLMSFDSGGARPAGRSVPGAVLLLAAFALLCSGQDRPAAASDDAVWADFIAWLRTAPVGESPIRVYAAKLAKEGLTEQEIGRRAALVVKLFTERPEGAEVVYDRTYSRPATGDPAEDGFESRPSELLMEAVRGLAPGKALDVGTGQGRNAVWLAGQGWDVTGVDVSGVGLTAARANAAKAGVTVRTVKAAYGDYDFGAAKWDLLAFVFAWAPVSDSGFMRRIKDSLRPGGTVVFEHFVKDAAHPYPPMVRALEPGELRRIFSAFEIVFYEEKEGLGDWGGPGSSLVRMIARKRA